MAAVCGNSLHICHLRATRLNANGTVAAGPNNHVVTGNPVILTAEPEILEGEQKNLVGGCDCLCATYKGYDKLLRWNLTIQFCALEPALLEILLGADLQVNGSSEPIGNDWPNQLTCDQATQPPVAIEAWTDLWVGDAQSTTAGPYIRFYWPMAFFQMDQFQLENDFMLPQVKGFTRSNANWSDPYNDQPVGVVDSPTGGYFYDDSVPTDVCGYSSFST